MRFPFFFSLPLLAFARWRGCSWSEVHGSVKHGYWDFRRSWLMRNLFPWVLLLDASLASAWKVHLPLRLGWTIVCERFVLDMLVDLAVALDDPAVSTHLPGSLFVHLLPRRALVIFLDLDQETIIKRRSDLQSDRKLHSRLEAYRSLSIALHIPMCSSLDQVTVVNQSIRDRIGHA